jgi:hypothetical protein
MAEIQTTHLLNMLDAVSMTYCSVFFLFYLLCALYSNHVRNQLGLGPQKLIVNLRMSYWDLLQIIFTHEVLYKATVKSIKKALNNHETYFLHSYTYKRELGLREINI